MPLYNYAAEQIVAVNGPSLVFIQPRLKQNGDSIAKLTQVNENALSGCVRSYLERSKEDTQETGPDFTCGFDSKANWLVVSYHLGSQLVQFAFGPRE